MSEIVRKLVIYDRRTGTDHQVLEARLTDGGDLVLQGHDLGETSKQFWGDDDYEYSRTVDAAHVPAVLLWLIKERFDSDAAFAAWLKERGIPCAFDNWV